MLASVEYIKTVVNGLKQWVESLPRPNWDQNDETAKDYIKNRTHYDPGSEERSIIIEPDSNGNFSPPLPLIIGNKYKVYYGKNVNDLYMAGEFEALDVAKSQGKACPSGISAVISLQRAALLYYDHIERPPDSFGFWYMVSPACWKIEGNFSAVKALDNKYLDSDFKNDLLKMADKIIGVPTNLENGTGSRALQQRPCEASGEDSMALGFGTKATGENQLVGGKYNVEDSSGAYAHIIGNGPNVNVRRNAYTLDWEGNGWFSGDVYTGSTSGKNRDAGSKKLATEDYVNAAVAETGETWELIGEATCAENAASFIMDKDADGNPFALKEIAIITYSPAFTGDTTSYGRSMGLYPGCRWGTFGANMANAPMAKNNEVARYELHYFKMYGGGMRLVRRWMSQNSTNVRCVLMPMNNAGDAPIGFVSGAEDPFTLSGAEFSGPATCVKIYGYTNTTVSAGTKVKVWGVRA